MHIFLSKFEINIIIKMKTIIIILLLSLLCVYSQITIDTYNGSGCPQGTVSINVAPDNSYFNIIYSKYTSQVGIGSSPTDFRKNCQIYIKINDDNKKFSIKKTVYNGFTHLEDGANSLFRFGYNLQEQISQFNDKTFEGPFEDNWQVIDNIPFNSTIWSNCDNPKNLFLNTQLRVDAGSSDPQKTTSFITMDSTDGSIMSTYYLDWSPC